MGSNVGDCLSREFACAVVWVQRRGDSCDAQSGDQVMRWWKELHVEPLVIRHRQLVIHSPVVSLPCPCMAWTFDEIHGGAFARAVARVRSCGCTRAFRHEPFPSFPLTPCAGPPPRGKKQGHLVPSFRMQRIFVRTWSICCFPPRFPSGRSSKFTIELSGELRRVRAPRRRDGRALFAHSGAFFALWKAEGGVSKT